MNRLVLLQNQKKWIENKKENFYLALCTHIQCTDSTVQALVSTSSNISFFSSFNRFFSYTFYTINKSTRRRNSNKKTKRSKNKIKLQI